VGNDVSPIKLVFWRSLSGNEPVRVWLSELTANDKKTIGRDIAKLQFGWPVGMPICRSLKGGLWEIRSSLPSGNEARLIFCFHQGLLVALHAFIKKSQATPAADLNLAKSRLKELQNAK
jgi:phage-related protein